MVRSDMIVDPFPFLQHLTYNGNLPIIGIDLVELLLLEFENTNNEFMTNKAYVCFRVLSGTAFYDHKIFAIVKAPIR